MKCSLRLPGKNTVHPLAVFRASQNAAFTLVELLVAMVIMTMILAMFSQTMGSVTLMWSGVKGGVENYTAARGILDDLQVDLSKAVIRSDLGAFCDKDGTTGLSFYTERAGLDAASTDRQLQLVSYSIQPTMAGSTATTMTLQRSALQVDWNDASSLSFGTTDTLPLTNSTSANNAKAAQGILGLAVKFLNTDGTLNSTFTLGSSHAVIVSLAVVSGPSEQRLTSAQMTALETLFATAAEGATSANSVQSAWNAKLNDSSVWTAYPGGTAGNIHVFSRTYGLTDCESH